MAFCRSTGATNTHTHTHTHSDKIGMKWSLNPPQIKSSAGFPIKMALCRRAGATNTHTHTRRHTHTHTEHTN